MDIKRIMDHKKVLEAKYNTVITWKYNSKTNTFQFYKDETTFIDEIDTKEPDDDIK